MFRLILFFFFCSFSCFGQSALDEVDDEDGENISYEDLIEFNGSLNIYLSEEDDEVIISQGDIGSNSEE